MWPAKQHQLADELLLEVMELLDRVSEGTPKTRDTMLLPLTAPKLDHYTSEKLLKVGDGCVEIKCSLGRKGGETYEIVD